MKLACWCIESSTMSEERLSSKAVLHINRNKERGLIIWASESLKGRVLSFLSAVPTRTSQKMYPTLGLAIFRYRLRCTLVFFFFLVLPPTTVLIFHNFSLCKGQFSRIVLRLDPWRVSHISCVTRSRIRHISQASHHPSLAIQWFAMFVFWSLKYP